MQAQKQVLMLASFNDALNEIIHAAILLRSELPDLAAFSIVVRRRSFKAATIELRITASALSHAIRRLEERLGAKAPQSYKPKRRADARRLLLRLRAPQSRVR